MKRFLQVVSVCLLTSISLAQGIKHDWAKGFLGAGESEGIAVTSDDDENVYVTGLYEGIIDFDPGLDSLKMDATEHSIFIVKLNSDGELIWVKSIKAIYSLGEDIAVASDGSVYVTGFFTGTLDFNPGSGINELTSKGGSDIFVLKLDSDGNYIWARSIGGNSNDMGNQIEITKNNNVIIYGKFNKTVDFNPLTATANLTVAKSSGFVLKLSNYGTYYWAKKLETTGFVTTGHLNIDKYGDILLSGEFSGTLDLNPSSGIKEIYSDGNSSTTFALKLSSNGIFKWGYQGGKSQYGALGSSITSDIYGNVYLAGTTTDTADFDPSSGESFINNSTNQTVFIVKLSSAGSFLWVTSTKKNLNIFTVHIGVTDDNCPFLTTRTYTTLFHNPNTKITEVSTDFSGPRLCFVKFDTDGKIVLARTTETEKWSYTRASHVTSQGNIYTTGVFKDYHDFDLSDKENLIVAGGYESNGFVLKTLGCQGVTGIDSQFVCSDFMWIDSTVYTSDSDTSSYILLNAAANGCDSTVRLNLKISNTRNNNIEYSDDPKIILKSKYTYGDFKWLNCNSTNAIIPLENDSVFYPLENGNFAVEITDSIGCLDTTECFPVISVSSKEIYSKDILLLTFNNQFILKLPKDIVHYKITISDLNGKVVAQQAGNNELLVKLPQLKRSSLYFLCIQINSKDVKFFKLIFQ